MQVLVDLHRLRSHPFNGLYRFCAELGGALSRLPAEPGLDLHYYVPPSAFDVFGPGRYVAQHSRDKYFRFGTGRYDVWHAATTLSWYRPFNRRTRFVFTVHDLHFLHEEERSARHKERYRRLIQGRIRRAHHLTYISDYARQQTEAELDTEGKPWTVVYNGCNLPPAGVETVPAVRPQQPFLFSVGLFVARKNFAALPALLEGNDYELVLAGVNDLPYRAQVEEAIRRFGVKDRVHLTGPVSEGEKFWYYRNCLAFAFPSVGEGFGLPILEAMHFGKPVFLSTATCLPEIGGDAAYYFPSFEPEAMRATLEAGLQHYAAEHPQDRIRARAARFSWDAAARQYLGVYKEVVR